MTPTEQMAADARDAGATLALDAEQQQNAFYLEWALSKAARSFPTFTSDEVHGLLREIGVTELRHPNAMGEAFLCAARAGIIENTGRVQKSARIAGHRRAVAIWRSMIFNHPTISPEEPRA